MTNFNFLKTEFPAIYTDAVEAEEYALTAPKYSAILCRSSLEKAVNWLYQQDGELILPYDTALSSLMHEPCFRNLLDQQMLREINIVRLTGNNAAHGKSVTQYESLASLKNLFRFLSFLSRYYSEENPEIVPFDESVVPEGKVSDKTLEQLKETVEKLSAESEKLKEERLKREEQAREIELLKQQLETERAAVALRKEERRKEPGKAVPVLLSEAETRKIYIELLLKEAGWDNLRYGSELEYKVTGMPTSTNPSGTGYADYVLWGDNGLPLAVIEAKKTMSDVHQGQHQAELYANCLEAMTGQRPVIFYTNGFETKIWDDTFYPPRDISGFYTKEELELTIARRKTRSDLRQFKANASIAGYPYQLEAIKRIAETLVTGNSHGLRGKSRKALLVMATGSGKTRVAASIVDMLIKCNWIKRVLFLADRNALVTQAKDTFKEHLPNLTAIDLTKETEDNGTRLVFSTYPTIMNRIDGTKNGDVRFYGPGHFDLIIIDEAHRSVYQKYKAIFDYFDALLIGLTATPKTDIDRNTYALFDIADNNPTFAYELSEAVSEHYLVPPKAIDVPIKFPREGIKYKDLSEEEKAEYEEKFGDPTIGEADDEIEGSALNDWLFNANTVDRVLDHLMTRGIKTQGGDKLGKTIIFARNHKHAVFIEERFNLNYPEYSGKFLRVIDNYDPKAEDLLKIFCYDRAEEDPQIAVSVDMLDTGVDAPRVVNLVFFKPVKSRVKYWQMIGRGTRLFPDIFAPGKDKEYFLIFDFCGNFEFFNEFPEGIIQTVQKSLSQQLFETKLQIAMMIRSNGSSEEESGFAEECIHQLHQQISTLDDNRFIVRQELRLVTEYSHAERWQNLSKGDFIELCNHLSGLPAVDETEDETARRFDLIVLKLQLTILLGNGRDSLVNRIAGLAKQLIKKRNIPAVNEKIETIRAVESDEFWEHVSLNQLEKVRRDLRDLIKFIDTEKKKIVYTDFEDTIGQSGEVDILPTYPERKSYRERVESFVRKNKDFLVIHKILNNVPITHEELKQLERMLFDGEVGTEEDYQKEYGDMPLVKFIRSLLGLDTGAARQLFSGFIQAGSLSADQIRFINQIIDFLGKNGTIDQSMLYESPFTDSHDQGISGLFDDEQARKIVKIIDEVNEKLMRS